MKETLHIKNFGPIKDMKLELGKVNVLIGNQGTGKSTVAKVLSAIRKYTFLGSLDQDGNDLKTKTEIEAFQKHLAFYGILNCLNDSTMVKYQSNFFTFNYSNNKIEKIISNTGFSRLHESARVAQDLYIPTERIYLSSLTDSMFALAEINAPIPKLFLRFGSLFNQSRKNKESFSFSNIISYSYKIEGGEYWVALEDGKKISLSESSSAIQGLIPLLVTFSEEEKKRNSIAVDGTNFLTIIEEPEINLFPETQKALLAYIVEVIQEPNSNTDLVLTTHSPYILTSLNNLMYAYQVGQENKEKTNEIINQKCWLNPEDVSAYLLLADGSCEDIFDYEEKLIKAEKIDEVSNIINDEFNKLIDIELQNENT